MFDKLAATEQQYEELMNRLGSAELQSDPAEYRKQAKALSDIEETVERFREYKAVVHDIEQTEGLVSAADADMRELAQEELKGLVERRDVLVGELKVLLVPKDPNDQKNVVLEIRGGTGGDEAALFAGELFRMYAKYAERQGWRLEMMSSSESGVGGLKEAIATIEGKGVYSKLKYESGVHRSSACRQPKRADEFIRRQRRWRSFPKPRRSTSRSMTRTCASTRSARADRVAEREHDLFGRADHAHPHRRGRVAAGREIADQEPGEGHESAASAVVRDGAAQAAGSDRQGPEKPGGHRRTVREDSHLQLSAEPNHRPPDQLHDPPARECTERRPRELLDNVVTYYQSEKLKDATAVS
jgi:hypothetical protein